ncbi:hypothetical protein U14_00049 [Candidatus Moduliflexus flocculans]|uniref:PilT protein domain protein n=1 Tax=Candidatus Moduliflexus flocculans TaxID=1499966 RepID=A0A0S6VV27_9BACT|nr:hypothetical protein U14_00049 [Candidatus Moduliflexus flocculans]
MPIIRIKTLSNAQYAILPDESLRTGLDFDDVYQFLIGREQGFAIVTMDQDFQKIQTEHLITFL